MSRTVREFMRGKLSARSLERIRYYKWLSDFFLARSIASIFARHAPTVEGFPGDTTPKYDLDQLRAINVSAPTKMCTVMTWYGSDKGRGWHNYTTIYSVLLGSRRNQDLLILELGLGTNNPNLVSTMGEHGRPGASLRGWRQLFPRALVYGADIDRDILFEEDRIKTFYCDQTDGAAISALWSQPALRGGCDIIIDDGLHTFEGNVSFLDGSLEHLRPGGVYVVEDIVTDTLQRWRERLDTVYSKQFPNHEFALVILPNEFNEYDNNLLIARRRS